MPGDNRYPFRRRANRGKSKDGKYKTSDGYMLIYRPNHPYAFKNGCVSEHRLVVEQKIGRYLLPSETVHHKGIRYSDIKNRSDNLIDNLELRIGQHGKGIALICASCELREEVVELKKQVKLLKWQVKQANELLYGSKSEAPDWF